MEIEITLKTILYFHLFIKYFESVIDFVNKLFLQNNALYLGIHYVVVSK